MTQQPGSTPSPRGTPDEEVPPTPPTGSSPAGSPAQPAHTQPVRTEPVQPTHAQSTPATSTTPATTPVEQPRRSRKEERAARTVRHDRHEHEHHDGQDGPDGHDRHDHVDDPAREKFGGVNLGAAFFGWIVAIGVTVLLAGIVSAITAAVGNEVGIRQSELENESGTVGLASAIALLVVLAIGYYAGGYVAGRMSRFDGGRQGIAVWVIGLLVTLLAVGLGVIFGNEYNVLERVDLPSIKLSDDTLGWGAVITGLAVLLGTLLAAFLGGVVGRRYHHRVDRVAGKAWEDAARIR